MENRKIAFVVGNGTYDNEMLPQLPGAIHDAKTIYHHLLSPEFGGFDYSLSQLCIDLDYKHITNQISRLITRVSHDDLVLFYFAGHGEISKANMFYFLLSDSDPDCLAFSALSAQQLWDIVVDNNLRKVIFIYDCCYSVGLGHLTKSTFQHAINEFGERFYQVSGDGFVFAASTRNLAVERETPAGQHGLFSYYFLEALRTGTGSNKPELSIMDILHHVSKRVQGEGLQNPVYWGSDIATRLLISRNPIFDKSFHIKKQKARDFEIKLNRQLIDIANKYGNFSLLRSKLQEALMMYDELTNINYFDASLHLSLLRFALFQNDKDRALKSSLALTEIDPTYWHHYLKAGCVHAFWDYYDEAAELISIAFQKYLANKKEKILDIDIVEKFVAFVYFNDEPPVFVRDYIVSNDVSILNDRMIKVARIIYAVLAPNILINENEEEDFQERDFKFLFGCALRHCGAAHAALEFIEDAHFEGHPEAGEELDTVRSMIKGEGTGKQVKVSFPVGLSDIFFRTWSLSNGIVSAGSISVKDLLMGRHTEEGYDKEKIEEVFHKERDSN